MARRRAGKSNLGGDSSPRGGGGYGSDSTGPPSSPRAEEAALLRDEISRLRHMLAKKDGGLLAGVRKCGYLYKFRPWAGLLEQPWSLRYFSLSGDVLVYYKTEKEKDQYPRGSVHLPGCTLRIEGFKRSKYYTICILDSRGDMLMRLSTADVGNGRDWVTALQEAGCRLDASSSSDAHSESERSTPPLHPFRTSSDSNASPSGPHRLGPQDRTASTDSLRRLGDVKDGEDLRINKLDPKMMRASTPVHQRVKYSLLSSESLSYQRHAGLINLGMVIILAANSRLILENMLKYGILIKPGFWLNVSALKDWPLLLAGLTLPMYFLLALSIERLAAFSNLPDKAAILFHILNICASFFVPSYVIHRVRSEPLTGVVLLMLTMVTWMKLVSYACVCYDERQLLKQGKQQPQVAANAEVVQYPENISLRNVMYFMAAPTLCYQLSFPRSPRLRARWLLRRIGELIVFMSLELFIIEQYVQPIILNARQGWEEMHFGKIVERVLKLSLPVLYVWLCGFYTLFHLWLNILAEILRFGDREFYKDWWNATTIEQYWRLWNMPVHKWLLRHIYFPALRLGLNKSQSILLVFFVSAVMHEVLVGIPCHMLRLWAFMGIMMQVPLIIMGNIIQKKLKNDSLGNMLFWLTFCIFGQPICLLLYYHDVANAQIRQPSAGLLRV